MYNSVRVDEEFEEISDNEGSNSKPNQHVLVFISPMLVSA